MRFINRRTLAVAGAAAALVAVGSTGTAVAGSLIAGPALGWVSMRLLNRVQHIPTAIILQFVTTFGVWRLAEQLGLSAVLTMVCYAATVARTSPTSTPARLRIPTYAVWDTARNCGWRSTAPRRPTWGSRWTPWPARSRRCWAGAT